MSLRHPILANPRDLVFYLCAVSTFAVLLSALAAGGSDTAPRLDALLVGLLSGLGSSLVGMLAWWVYGSIPLKVSGLARWTVTHVALALGSAYLLVLAGRGWSRVLERAFAGRRPPDRFRIEESDWLIAGVLLYALTAGCHYLSHLAAASRAAELRATTFQASSRDARLKAFKAQIDPHFLFNSLHSLSSLCGFDPRGARRMAILLADFFRGSVEAGRRDWLPLGEELGLLEKYLEIEKVRFEDRLAVELEADEETRKTMIPTFLLQPLVENAVKHGIASLTGGGTVRLEAGSRDGRLEVTVSNPCDPDRPRRRGTGTGLANVRGRLLTLFGPEAGFDVDESAERFRVKLAMPAHEEDRRG